MANASIVAPVYQRRTVRTTIVCGVAAVAFCAGCDRRDAPGDAGGPDGAGPPYNERTLPGTTSTGPPGPDSARRDSAAPGDAPAQRPATLVDTIRLEGTPEPILLRLVRSPDGIEPGFSLYVPRDFEVAFEQDSADAMRITAVFAGQRAEDAYIHVRLYPEGTTESLAREAVLGFVQARQPRDGARETDRYGWARAQYAFRYGGPERRFTGSIGLGQHAGRWFHVLVHYPAEYGDGMGPRVALILDSWRWSDDGRPLHR